jgi:hypothetical protein
VAQCGRGAELVRAARRTLLAGRGAGEDDALPHTRRAGGRGRGAGARRRGGAKGAHANDGLRLARRRSAELRLGLHG